MHDWFTYYKVARGNGLNTIVGDAYVNASVATSVISDAHKYWSNLMKGKTEADDIMRNQTSQPRWCQTYIDKEETTEEFGLPSESRIEEAARKPEKYEYWYYLDEEFQLIELPEKK